METSGNFTFDLKCDPCIRKNTVYALACTHTISKTTTSCILLCSVILFSTNNNAACDDSAWLHFGTLQCIVRELRPLMWRGLPNKTGRAEMDFVFCQYTRTFHWQCYRTSFTFSKHFRCSRLALSSALSLVQRACSKWSVVLSLIIRFCKGCLHSFSSEKDKLKSVSPNSTPSARVQHL